MQRKWFLPPALGLIILALGCSSGPKAPQPGTPEFMWSAAKTTYGAGDFLKANDNLSQLAKGTSEYAARSRPLVIVISAGIAKGYSELADNFEVGARANRANPTPFRRQVNVFRSMASTAAVQTAEAAHDFLKSNPPETIAIELGYPSGAAAPPVSLQRVAKGMMLPDAEIETLQKEMLQRGVLLSMTRNVGAGEDTAKALEMFKAGSAKVTRPVFTLEAARTLCDLTDLYTPKKLDQPNRMTLLTGEADEALQAIPASKETKDLAARLAKIKKPGKKT